MSDPFYFVDNTIQLPNGDSLPAKITALFQGRVEMMIEVKYPDRRKVYLLPEHRDDLTEDIENYISGKCESCNVGE